MGFTSGLTLLFIALKMTGIIDWSWWLVVSPLLGLLTLQVLAGVLSAVIDIRRQIKTKDAVNFIKELAAQELAKRNNQ